jgi:hypothetical protein
MDPSDADRVTLAVPCPDCGQMSSEPISRLAAHDVIPCSLCGGLIDLSVDNCREVVEQAKTLMTNIE